MTALILDPEIVEKIIEQRREWGADKYDEVWEGVCIMPPLPNNEHQELATLLSHALVDAVHLEGFGLVRTGVNVSDREEQWEHNYRCPDVAVSLNDTQAKNCGAFWLGGPDLAIEIISPYDKTRDKIAFYDKVATRELLLIDRNPWQLELYHLQDGKLSLAGISTVDNSAVLETAIVSLTFDLIPGEERPRINVVSSGGEKHWQV